MTAIVRDGLVFDGARLLGVVRDATPEQRERYLRLVRWGVEVSRFEPGPEDTGPDSRSFTGIRAGDIRIVGTDRGRVEHPELGSREVDLAGFADDDRLRVSWVNLDAPSRRR